MPHDTHDIIGTRPPVDLGPLFAQPTVAAAEGELRADFIATPGPSPRAHDETDTFTPPAPLSELERQRCRTRIQDTVRGPLCALAHLRRNACATDLIGVTAADARRIADQHHLSHLLGAEQRSWSWLSEWLQSLAREHALTKWRFHGIVMKRMAENGNDQVIYLDPYDHRAQDVA